MTQLITVDRATFPHPVYLTAGKQPLIGYIVFSGATPGIEELVFEPSPNLRHCTAELLTQLGNQVALSEVTIKATTTGRIPMRKKK